MVYVIIIIDVKRLIGITIYRERYNMKPTTIINAGSYLEGLRDNFKLDVKLIAQKKHPKVYLLSREEISLTLASIDTSIPEGWNCAMATLKAIYWNNFRGYSRAISEIPSGDWLLPSIRVSQETPSQMLTRRLRYVNLTDNEDTDDTTIDPKEITDNVKYAGGVRRNGFGGWVCSLFGHNPDAVSKGSQGS